MRATSSSYLSLNAGRPRTNWLTSASHTTLPARDAISCSKSDARNASGPMMASTACLERASTETR